MALPSNFNTGHVHGQFMDLAGNPIPPGSVTFTPSPNRIVDAAALLVIIPIPLVRILDGTGSISVDLPATNDPDITPIGFTYHVTENFPGGAAYNIPVPVGSSTDLSTIVAVNANTGIANLVGAGVPPGGMAHQVLAKLTAADYDDTWQDQTSGSTTIINNVGSGMTFTQSAPATTWGPFTHGLSYEPNVTLITSAGDEFIASVHHGAGTVTAVLISAISGTLVCS